MDNWLGQRGAGWGAVTATTLLTTSTQVTFVKLLVARAGLEQFGRAQLYCTPKPADGQPPCGLLQVTLNDPPGGSAWPKHTHTLESGGA